MPLKRPREDEGDAEHPQSKRRKDTDTVFECEICAKRFGAKFNLNKHIRHFHNNTYTCNICNKTYRQLRDLHKHMTTHTHDTHNSDEQVLEESDDGLASVLETIDEGLRGIYRENWEAIKTHFHEPKPNTLANQSTYTIRWAPDQDWEGS